MESMNVDFNKLATDQLLGSGKYATTYLVEIKNKKYVYKIQKLPISHLNNGNLKYNEDSDSLYPRIKIL
jgi:hypothetical protein